MAAEQNYVRAFDRLGYAYQNGIGVLKDPDKAVFWLTKAGKGSAEAAYEIGEIYYHGRGVEKDDTEAVRWWRMAAEQNYVRAFDRLGYAYKNGIGVPKDLDKAIFWLTEADRAGSSYGRSALAKIAEAYRTGEADEVIRDSAFGRAPDKRVCSMAIENGSWQRRESLQKWVDEARDRGLTLEDCEKVLKANEVSRVSPTTSRQTVDPRESDGRVCIMARAVWRGKRGDEFDHWVEEAQKRNLTPEICDKLLEVN